MSAPRVFSNDHDFLVVILSNKSLDELSATQGSGTKPSPLYTAESPSGSDSDSTFSVYFPLNLDSELVPSQERNIRTALSILGIQSDPTPAMLQGTNIRLYRAMGPAVLMKPEDSYSALQTNPPYLISVSLSPRPTDGGEIEADFNAWYEQEHIDLLSKVPGWMACRRYMLLDHLSTPASFGSSESEKLNNPPTHLALHALKDLDGAFSSPEHKAATNTPWRTRVMSEIVAKERYPFRLVSD
ncbi:hypothetical protein GYMLUDRAFT_43168 [Collybiopsis luxurians FD-317 M1]|uniref:Unplaced genomic scaffold GYMLUscaffold_24, whole genome shotgun sequence n=1 Tax=Collybiopsis luxurians FD-317 M1 TaxID=944289 RepID=A0A0D0BYZ2_9AGAR|nr:hypothetical protein GYMLUDRAFT_43168 [Collybiopsis luxurians FD-317 M1]